MRKKIAIVAGTRPEAIKLAPLILELSRGKEFKVLVLAAAQHRELLDEALGAFGIRPDVDFDLMRERQTPNEVLARVIERMAGFLRESRPDMVVVQGDTTTAAGAALAAFNERVPVAHVEAGLRTGDFRNPFPEEGNRVLIDHVSALCFAPTAGARDNLLREGIARSRVMTTGNTIIDAVRQVLSAGKNRPAPELPAKLLSAMKGRRAILVTLHRRESFGAPMRSVARGLRKVLDARADVMACYPVHPNPEVRRAASSFFKHPRIVLEEPLDYPRFLDLMRRCRAIVSDSGGIQEEAASLHKPVIIARDETERPEIIAAGGGILAGRRSASIAAALGRVLDDSALYRRMSSCKNPFGDGRASHRIAAVIGRFLAKN